MSPATAQPVPPGAMGADVARQVRALLRHLDGSAPTDPARLTHLCRRLDTNAAITLDLEDGLRERPLTEAFWAAGEATGARGRRTLR